MAAWSTATFDRDAGESEFLGQGGGCDVEVLGDLGECLPAGVAVCCLVHYRVRELAWRPAGDGSALEVAYGCGAVNAEFSGELLDC